MRKRQRRVLLLMGWYEYRLYRGIAAYAQEHGWHLSPDMMQEKVIPWGWSGDGILAWLGEGDDLADFVVRTRKPTIDFSFRRPHLKLARVLFDSAQEAQLVADHFLSRGLANFVYYSDRENWAYEEVGNAFVEILRQAGRKCAWLRWHRSSTYRAAGRSEVWMRKRKWLASELKGARKPLAVFAASDRMASDVLEACESAHLNVPEDVAIVGSDNSLPAVDAMHTPISSVDPNYEGMGYRGAALLDELMDGKPPPKKPIRWPSSGLIVRKSSDLMAVQHPGVAKSLKFIWEHCHEPIGIEDLMKVSAMSRSGLHQAFLDQIGRAPGHELHRVRIERAKRLLAEPCHKIDAVAAMCGYHSSNSFWVAFRQATGISPKRYRETFFRPVECETRRTGARPNAQRSH